MRTLILFAAALALAGCKQNVELPSIISPYRIDIQQGNVVTQDMVGKLKVGMTRSHVGLGPGPRPVPDMVHSQHGDDVAPLQRAGKRRGRGRASPPRRWPAMFSRIGLNFMRTLWLRWSWPGAMNVRPM